MHAAHLSYDLLLELKNKGFRKVKIGQSSVLALFAWKGADGAHTIHCVNMLIRNMLKRLAWKKRASANFKTAW